jgi:hypothetical protein
MLKKRRLAKSRETMTLPDERYRAVRMAAKLMQDLCDPKTTPRIPGAIRARALGVLRHYPGTYDLDRAAAAAPDVFIKQLDPLYKMVKRHDMQDRMAEDVEEDLRAAHARGEL